MARILFSVVVGFILARLCQCANSTLGLPDPLSLPPSQYWDGDDGPWSTFLVQVGTPPQQVRLLPATGESSTWVVLPEGCTSTGPVDCPNLRGFEFSINLSSTWQNNAIYQLNLYEESALGYTANAKYGYDTLTLGIDGKGLPTLEHQIIAGIATEEFYLGNLGINPRPLNFSDLNDPQPSMLHTLRNQSMIPSTSWSYTAGGYNHVPRTYGSLVFGGYDTSRFVANNITFNFAPDISRDLLPAVQSITTNISNTPLLSTPIYAFIDSLIPDIWLPLKACHAFEQAFGLGWDNTTESYLVNDSFHSTLLQKNPFVTFNIGPDFTGDSVSIRMPYWAFDLTATYPLVANNTRYFPLQRADNDTQYTLGRAFLQSAHLIVDYERSNFSISQALFPNTSVSQNLVRILPPPTVINGITPPSNSPKGSQERSLSAGAIVGIVVGSVLAGILITTGIFLLVAKRSKNPYDDGGNTAPAILVDDELELGGTPAARPGVQGVASLPLKVREMEASIPTRVGLEGSVEQVKDSDTKE
ncbi:acid protease [Lepidopterella palustris CBS 459.81]|uniref:Acid protease n=1 Tax=Lepidopterella palustris CBS 459.81 TaxID=1314670 RepID=A0A8E2E2B2_9PEZI|nr:acid protease [Lepidopterella palustris CBS 459.81]